MLVDCTLNAMVATLKMLDLRILTVIPLLRAHLLTDGADQLGQDPPQLAHEASQGVACCKKS